MTTAARGDEGGTALATAAGSTPAATADRVAALRQRLRRWPDEIVMEAIVEEHTGGEEEARELVEEAWSYAADLAGPDPSPIERTLAETAAVCWLALRVAEWRLEKARSLELHKAHWMLKRVDSYHRKYLGTLKTLATVRRLAAPSVRVVNLGQMNVKA